MNQTDPLAGVDADIAEAAPAIFQQVLAAHAARDHAQLAGLLTEAAAQALTADVFHNAVDRHLLALGPMVTSTCLGSLQKHGGTLVLWKLRYAQSDQDVLWQLHLTRSADGVRVAGLFFG